MAAICCLDENATNQVSARFDEVVGSWSLHNRDYGVVHRFDENDSCLRNYLRYHTAYFLRSQARHPLHILLELEVIQALLLPSNDDLIHATLQMLVYHSVSLEEAPR